MSSSLVKFLTTMFLHLRRNCIKTLVGLWISRSLRKFRRVGSIDLTIPEQQQIARAMYDTGLVNEQLRYLINQDQGFKKKVKDYKTARKNESKLGPLERFRNEEVSESLQKIRDDINRVFNNAKRQAIQILMEQGNCKTSNYGLKKANVQLFTSAPIGSPGTEDFKGLYQLKLKLHKIHSKKTYKLSLTLHNGCKHM